jgi:CDP-diacylglycerol--glycerol-3-phosphate 3-phosphatidyltransferase
MVSDAFRLRDETAGTEPRSPRESPRGAVANLPNALTALRFVLCLAFFGILIYCSTKLLLPVDGTGQLSWTTLRGEYREAHAGLRKDERGLALLLDIAFVIFLLAAATDTLDGQIARRYGLETDLGRIADPFVDKIMILGALTLLLPLTVHLRGWMVVLVLARELLVSGIRGFAEARGVPFPATFWGKTKMVSQTACVAAAVLYVGHPDARHWEWTFLALLWWTIAATVLSGAVYVRRAVALLRPGGAVP